jgi:hypothetical protein
MVAILITWLRGREGQITAWAFAVMSLPIYLAVYWDRLGHLLGARHLLSPLAWLDSGDARFHSTPALAWLVLSSYFLRAMVFVAVRYRPRAIDAAIEDVNDSTLLLFTSFTAYSTVSTAVVSVYHLGWLGSTVAALIGVILWIVALDGVRQTAVLLFHIAREPFVEAADRLVDGALAITGVVVQVAGTRRAGDSETLSGMTTASKARSRDRHDRGRDRHARREALIVERHRRIESRRRHRARAHAR